MKFKDVLFISVTSIIVFGLGLFFILKFNIFDSTSLFFHDIEDRALPQVVEGEGQAVTTENNHTDIVNDPKPSNAVYSDGKFVITDAEWVLDTFDAQSIGPYVIFSAYHGGSEYYGVFRFNRKTGEIINLFSNKKRLGFVGYDSLNQFSAAQIKISPDEQKFFWYVYSSFYFPKNLLVMQIDGREITVNIPKEATRLNWFTNNQISFVPTGVGYETASNLQIIDLNTARTFTTQIPVSLSISNPKINPDTTAYASTEYGGSTIFGREYTCAAGYHNFVVHSYPEGKELYRLDGLYHGSDYRWLNDGRLEIKYHKITESDLDTGCENAENQIETFFYTLPVR